MAQGEDSAYKEQQRALLCSSTRNPTWQPAGDLILPYIEFTNPKKLGTSACEGGGGSKHAYSKFSVFIESSLIYIFQKPIIIIICLQNANALCFPCKHFGINTTKLPEGFIPQSTHCIQNLALSQFHLLGSPSVLSLFFVIYNLPSLEAGT